MPHYPHFPSHGGPLRELIQEEDPAAFHERTAAYKRIPLEGRQVYDLELLLNGGFSPLGGFMTEEEYRSVVERMRLPDGTIWPIPIVLDVKNGDSYSIGERVVLSDPYGDPLGVMAIESIYVPDKEKESLNVYGTLDRAHPGVRHLFEETGNTYLGGKVEGFQGVKFDDFPHLRFSPRKLRERFRKNGETAIVAFQTRNPIHRAHYELMRRAADEHGAHVLIHPVVGMTKEGDIDYATRVRTYEALWNAHMKDFATLSLLPIAMRMAGPREALWHAIIRKNYGATHFIIGRDHAGPGKDSHGKPFYDPYAAQELVASHAKEIGMTIVPMKEMVYVEETGEYRQSHEIREGETTLALSGTEVRRRLRAGEEIPAWFSFPEVVHELRQSANAKRGVVIFFTGLASAGKSTLARALKACIENQYGRPVSLLDGDVVRHHLSKGLGFSKDDRNTNVRRIGFVAGEIAKHGGIALCAAIAPFRESREYCRRVAEEHGAFVEVYVSTSLEVCKARDPKGLYRKAEKGLVKHITGMDEPYEPPENPELTIDAGTLASPDEGAERILAFLGQRGLLERSPQEGR